MSTQQVRYVLLLLVLAVNSDQFQILQSYTLFLTGYGLLLELHVLTQATRSYVFLHKVLANVVNVLRSSWHRLANRPSTGKQQWKMVTALYVSSVTELLNRLVSEPDPHTQRRRRRRRSRRRRVWFRDYKQTRWLMFQVIMPVLNSRG